jgi:hypothetical protein
MIVHPVPFVGLAYIDLGSGSAIIQVLVATLVTVPFVARRAISRVIGRLRGHDRR